MKHDFLALERAVWAATAHDHGQKPEHQWCTEYPRAIEQAIAGTFTPLQKLLDAGEPLHPMLVPALADAMRARGKNRPGRKVALVTTEERMYADSVLALVVERRIDDAGRVVPQRRLKVDDAIAEVAKETGLSKAAVKRAYATLPAHRKPRRFGPS